MSAQALEEAYKLLIEYSAMIAPPVSIIHATEPLVDLKENVCFLCGPSPRDSNIVSWRKEAIELFEKHNYTGTLLIPEDRTWKHKAEYDSQVQWEYDGLLQSTHIMFWIPRDLNNMPGYTTNVEFGMIIGNLEWAKIIEKIPPKIVLGSPEGTPKMSYLNWHADRLGIPRYNTLEDTVKAITAM